MTDMASNHGKIARVFPRRTAATPEDPYAFTGPPPCGELPDISEVHISVTFTYDMQKAERLADMWSATGLPVRMGGPAFCEPGGAFVPGRYLKYGYVITSRGCPTDGDGYYNTDYGDVTFEHQDTPVVYYNQTDARWGNKLYGKTGTIGAEGCGPTALAIVVATLVDSSVTPYDVAKWSAETGHRCEGNGSYHSLIPDGGAHYGLTVTGIGNNSTKLVEALQDGKLVIALMSKGHFTNGGHFIVLRGITEDGKILVADPASVKRSNQEWELGIVVNEARRGAAAGGPFWVFS